MSERTRPVAHFTPGTGWINDPYGIRWQDGRYHLHYQALSDQVSWSPECAWGHAVSDDLVSWHEQPIALTPQPFEAGCWSGCVVEDSAGTPRAFYTRVHTANLELASIATARYSGASRLSSRPDDVVIEGPPDDVPLTAFRDPFVWRDRTGATMIVGAGIASGEGAILQYRSDDLDRWRFTGVLCRGRLASDKHSRRQVWECPQLIQVDGVWLLVVSVQLDGRAGPVMVATGDYDGTEFAVREWQQLTFGPAPYATSLFRDRDGRPGMMSWLREDPEHDAASSDWAGAESLVAELTVDHTGLVTAKPHNGLARSDAFVTHHLSDQQSVFDQARADPTRALHLIATLSGPVEIEIQLAGRRLVRVTRTANRSELAIDRPRHATDVLPAGDPTGTIELFLDADILEVFAGGAYGAWRVTASQ